MHPCLQSLLVLTRLFVGPLTICALVNPCISYQWQGVQVSNLLSWCNVAADYLEACV